MIPLMELCTYQTLMASAGSNLMVTPNQETRDLEPKHDVPAPRSGFLSPSTATRQLKPHES